MVDVSKDGMGGKALWQKFRKFLGGTPRRTFVLYPLITIAWEFWNQGSRLDWSPAFLPVMVWGFLQYRLCGLYRIRHGGGGPGLNRPPERLVRTGPYAFIRNPMYLGHIIFLIGLTLTFRSLLAGLITVATAVWFHFRVLGDEKKLAEILGNPYLDYKSSVKRWFPGLF